MEHTWTRRGALAGGAAAGASWPGTVEAAGDEIDWAFLAPRAVADNHILAKLKSEPTPVTVEWETRWTAQPDYWMLPRKSDGDLPGGTFELRIDRLERLLRAAAFEKAVSTDLVVSPHKMIFALRGCELQSGEEESGAILHLRTARPDHRDFRCVIGIADFSKGRLHAFTASTVAHTTGLQVQAREDVPWGVANYLPTGRYRFRVGRHAAAEYPGGLGFEKALRLSNPPRKGETEAGEPPSSQQVVLRPRAVAAGQRVAIGGDGAGWHFCVPSDNLHPSDTPKRQAWQKFSSEGCLVVSSKAGLLKPGASALKPTGLWERFAAVLDLEKSPKGASIACALFTGHEVFAFGMKPPLTLRPGSSGPRVNRLQTVLQVYGRKRQWHAYEGADDVRVQLKRLSNEPGAVDGDFGPQTTLAWLTLQSRYRVQLNKRLARETLSQIVTPNTLKALDEIAANGDSALLEARGNGRFADVFKA